MADPDSVPDNVAGESVPFGTLVAEASEEQSSFLSSLPARDIEPVDDDLDVTATPQTIEDDIALTAAMKRASIHDKDGLDSEESEDEECEEAEDEEEMGASNGAEVVGAADYVIVRGIKLPP